MFFKKKKKLVKVIKDFDIGTSIIRFTFKDGKILDRKIYGYVCSDGQSGHSLECAKQLINGGHYRIDSEQTVSNDDTTPTYSYVGFIQSLELISTNSYIITKEIEIYE